MIVSLQDIKQAFDLLINEQKSREEIADWAQKLMFANDDGVLKYNPPSDKDKIWDGIEYLMGVDLKDAPTSYLHSKENFIEYRNEKGL